MFFEERLITVSDMSSSINTNSIESFADSKQTKQKTNKVSTKSRLKTDHITIQMIVKTLNYLPFYNVLTPAIRHYIAESVQVESYLPNERINI